MAITFYNRSNGTDTPEEPKYVGAVLDTFERNGYHDSYWFALVWDDESRTVKAIETGSTAYYGGAAVEVDATDIKRQYAQSFAAHSLGMWLIDNHTTAKVGSKVKSLTTRGKAKGVIGEVIRFEESKFQTAWEARYSPKMVAVVRVENEDSPHCGRNVMVDPKRLEVTEELTMDRRQAYMIQALRYVERKDVRTLFHPEHGSLVNPEKAFA